MRMKRLMATLLVAAMVFTSQSFSGEVFAAETTETGVEAADETVNVEIADGDIDEVSLGDDELSDAAIEDETYYEVLDEEFNTAEEESVKIEEDVEAIEKMDENSLEAAGDYFDVDESTLTLLDGIILPSVVTIPDGVDTIPVGVFDGNAAVKEIKFGEESALTTIEAGAFKGSGIQRIVLPAGVTEIDDYVFKNSDLSEITFKGKIEKIGAGAFSGTQLTEIRSDYVTELGGEAFTGCTNLKIVEMPKLEIIGESAFEGCTKLNAGFEWSTHISEIGDSAFKNCGFTGIDFYDFKSVDPEKLGNKVFASNANLKTVSDSSVSSDPPEKKVSITAITSGLFMDCVKLESIKVPDSVTVIKSNAFSGCTALSKIILPTKVSMIESCAFSGCTNLKTVEIHCKDDVEIYSDAFPNKTGLILKGYSDKVRIFAINNGYTFESLYPNRKLSKVLTNCTVEASPAEPRAGETVTLKVKPLAGYALTEITYKYTNAEGLEETLPCDFFYSYGDYIVFEYVMPNSNVTITADAVKGNTLSGTPKVRIDEVPGYDLPTGSDSLKNNGTVTWAERGHRAKINVKFPDLASKQNYQNWLFDFTTTNEDIAMPVTDGVFYGIGYGTAVITATYKYDKSIKFTFTVDIKDDITIVKACFDEDDLDIDGKQPSNRYLDSSAKISVDPITGYPVITINKSSVEKSDMTFYVGMKAFTEDNPETDDVDESEISRMVYSYWSSTDTSIARVSWPKMRNNRNYITIKKGSQGEAQIAAYVLNTNETKPNTLEGIDEDNIANLIIRVVDVTPRLATKEITVNNQIVKGTKIDIVPVYGYEINDDVGLKVCYKETVNGITNYNKECPDLKASFDPVTGDVYLSTTNKVNGDLKLNATREYSNNLFICGEYKYAVDHDIQGQFRIPVTKVTIINKKLAPTLTITGKINLFYNETASDEDLGIVKIIESIKDVAIDKTKGQKVDPTDENDDAPRMGYELVSAVNHKNNVIKEDDSFANNFTIMQNPDYPDNPERIIICRSNNPIMKDSSKKNVVSGYLYIYFEGYREPCKVALTVPTHVTAPSYCLSKTSATANYAAKGQEYKLYLYPKGKANKYENAINLVERDPDDEETVIGPTYNHLAFSYATYSSSASANFINDPSEIEKNIEDNYITLKVPDGTRPKSGPIVIALRMPTWEDQNKYLFYTFKLNVSQTNPAAKVSASSRTFNKAFEGGNYEQYIEVYSSDPDAWITELDMAKLEYSPTKTNLYTYEQLAAAIDTGLYNVSKTDPKYDSTKQGRGIITLKLPDDPDIKTGTYYFKLTPKYSFLKNGEPDTEKKYNASKITFAVVIQNTQPTVKFGTTNFSFNSLEEVSGEEIITALTASGLLANTKFTENYEVDFDEVEIYKTTDRKKENCIDYASDFEASFEPDVANQKLKVTTTDAFETDVAHSCSYVIKGIKLIHESGDVACAKDITVTIKGVLKSPVVSVTGSGQINVIVAESNYIKYVSKVSYVNANVTKIEVLDLDESGTSTISDKFEMSIDDKLNNTAYLKIKPEALEAEKGDPDAVQAVKPNKDYKVVLRYYLDVTGDEVYYDINKTIRPVQTFPTIVVTPNWGYMYAGAKGNNLIDNDDTLNTGLAHKNQKVIAELEMPKNYYKDGVGGAQIVGLEWGKNVGAAMKAEFYPPVLLSTTPSRVDKITGKAYYKFVVCRRNAAEMKQNETFSLSISPIYKYQDIDTISTPSILKINVRK